ncbi:hypothetical protein [Fimbriiglobus ruber]|uniref:hypothetical protein n=1 Tax=Fimbriiglobus ruber TaxID=1908690 RepID=UPI001379E017|nr:hypothetical protein [Fimbriiglobus ruber]
MDEPEAVRIKSPRAEPDSPIAAFLLYPRSGLFACLEVDILATSGCGDNKPFSRNVLEIFLVYPIAENDEPPGNLRALAGRRPRHSEKEKTRRATCEDTGEHDAAGTGYCTIAGDR